MIPNSSEFSLSEDTPKRFFSSLFPLIMPFYGTLESLLEYSPSLGYFALQDSDASDEKEASLEDLLQEKVHSLSDILAQIQKDIQSRSALFENIVYRIYQHYCYLKGKLFELYIFPINGNRAIEGRRSNLEKQLDALLQEKRKEQVQCWQDIAALKKEFRVWFKQHRDLTQRVKLVLQRGSEVPRIAEKETFIKTDSMTLPDENVAKKGF